MWRGWGNVKVLCWVHSLLLLGVPSSHGRFATAELWMGLTALDWQWLTAEVACWLQCKSNFSCFISASWVLFCNGEAGMIYWVNLHFSDVAKAMVMSESQLRWTAVLLLLTTDTLTPDCNCHEGHTLFMWYVWKGLGSGLFLSRIVTSWWASVMMMYRWKFCVPCLTTLGGVLGLPLSTVQSCWAENHPLLVEEKK